MNPTTLKLGLRVVSLNGALKSDHTIGDKQLNVGDSPLAQSAKQLRPDDPVFRWGNTVVQHLFGPITANTDRDIDCLSLNGIAAQRNVGRVQEDTDILRLLELPVSVRLSRVVMPLEYIMMIVSSSVEVRRA